MNMKNFATRISGALLSLAFVFGVAAASNATQAQDRNDDRYYQRGRDDDRQDRNRSGSINVDIATTAITTMVIGDASRIGTTATTTTTVVMAGMVTTELTMRNSIAVISRDLNTGASDGQRNQSYNPQRSRYSRTPHRRLFARDLYVAMTRVIDSIRGMETSAAAIWQRQQRLGKILGGVLGRP